MTPSLFSGRPSQPWGLSWGGGEGAQGLRRNIGAAALSVLLLGAGGCAVTGQGTKHTTRFYVLRAIDPSAADSGTEPRRSDLTVAVGPVQLAAYLKRPHIVTLSGGNEVLLADFDRWAEQLEDGVSRVVAENLSLLLGTHRVVSLGPRNKGRPLFTVAIKVIRLDGRLGGDVFSRPAGV